MNIDIIEKFVDCFVFMKQHEDTPVSFPCFFCDFGEELPSLEGVMCNFEGVELSVKENNNGDFTFTVAGTNIVNITDPLADHLVVVTDSNSQFSTPSLERRNQFSVTHEMIRHEYQRFTLARKKVSGYWVLAVATSEVVELLINREGKIVKRLISERSRFIERRVYH